MAREPGKAPQHDQLKDKRIDVAELDKGARLDATTREISELIEDFRRTRFDLTMQCG